MLLRRGKVVSKEEEEAGERERGERKGGDGESEGERERRGYRIYRIE